MIRCELDFDFDFCGKKTCSRHAGCVLFLRKKRKKTKNLDVERKSTDFDDDGTRWDGVLSSHLHREGFAFFVPVCRVAQLIIIFIIVRHTRYNLCHNICS